MRYIPIAIIVAALALFTACQRETNVDVATTDTTATYGGTTAVAETATPSTAGQVGWGAWNEWDTDTDNRLTRAEYDSGFNRVYTGWAGTDNEFTADEARDTWRDWFDGNNDDIIDSNEWNTASTNWRLPGFEWGTYETWDVDRNNQIDRNEWGTGFNRAAANVRWTRDELANTWWDWWDGDNDDYIVADDWNTRSAYWR